MEFDDRKPRLTNRFSEDASSEVSPSRHLNVEDFRHSINLEVNSLIHDGFDMMTLCWLVSNLETIVDSDRSQTLSYLKKGFNGSTDQQAKLELLQAVDRVIGQINQYRRQVSQTFSSGSSSHYS